MDSPQEIEAIQEWNTYEGLNTDDEKPLIAPSVDITGDLDNALSGDIQFNGAFAAVNSYDSPNPCINLEGIGPIGMPLSEREARVIMAASSEGTGVEKGLWKFPGHKVHFDNSQWDVWLKTTAIPALNTTLGAHIPPTVLQYRLKSLVIREAHFEAINVYEEINEESFRYATLSVILSSRHVGGQLRATHQGTTKTFNTAGHGPASMTLVGTYAGVSQTLDPVQSGYVISLSYDLDYLGQLQSIPRLPQLLGTAMQLRNVFHSWRQQLDGASDDAEPPEFLACLLEHDYEDNVNFKAMSLIGADRLMLRHIAPVAKAYGFDLHFATVSYIETGDVELDVEPSYSRRYGGYGRYGRYGGYYDDSEEDEDDFDSYEFDASDVTMDEIDERTVKFSGITALDGMPKIMKGCAIDNLTYTEDEPDFNRYLVNGSMTDGDRESEFTRESRTSGSLTYTYTRSALVVTPEDSTDVVFEVGDIRQFACTDLKASLSEKPTAKEQRLVTSLQAWLAMHQTGNNVGGPAALTEVANVLRDSADRWNDVDLFLDTLKSCGPANCFPVVGVEGLMSAYQAFDWASLKSVYKECLSRTPSNAFRGQFIERLMATAREQEDTEVVSWCEAQRDALLATLQTLSVQEISWVWDLVQSKANPTHHLRNVLIPRLQAVQPSDMHVWTDLLIRVHNVAQARSPGWDADAHADIIKTCLERIGATMTPYPTNKKPFQRYDYNTHTVVTTTTEEITVEPIIALLELGARLDAFGGCLHLLHRMWAEKDTQSTTAPTRPAKIYYTSLVSRVDAFLRGRPQFKKALEPFFCQATSVLLLTSSSSSEFRLALQHSGNAITILKGFLTPERIKEMGKNRASLKELAVFVSHTLRPQAITLELKAHFETILKLCLAGMIGSFDLDLFTRPIRAAGYPYYMSTSVGASGVSETTGLLELCFTLQLQSDAAQVLAHLLGQPKANDTTFIKLGLAGTLKALPEFLKRHNLSLLDKPYSTFATEVVKKFVRHVLGPKPTQSVTTQELRALGCGCMLCSKHLVPFMTSDKQTTEIREKQAARTHLEGRLGRARGWGVTWQTIRQGSPHALKITKPLTMVALGLWAGNQIEAQALMKVLGNDQLQQQIMGREYSDAVGVIAGTAIAAMPLAPHGVNGVKRSADGSSAQAKKPRLS